MNLLSLVNLGVELMYEISRFEWNGVFPDNAEIDVDDDIVTIWVGTTTVFEQPEPYRLKNGYAVMAMYETFTSMILQREYYAVESEIRLRGRKIGSVQVRNYKDLDSAPNLTISAPASGGSNLTSSLGNGSGQIIDEEDANFKITYTLDTTRQLHSQDLFLAFLDGLATAAESGNSQSCKSMVGTGQMSTTGQGVIQVSEDSANTGSLSYDLVKGGLYLTWNDIVLKNRWFYSMHLSLEYAGVKVGDFWISGTGLQGNDGTTAVA